MNIAVLWAGLASIVATPATPSPPTQRFALVVGSNATLSPDQAPLRFADDDAARMTELLEELDTTVELVTTLDRDSQATFPELVGRARPATPEGLAAGWQALREQMLAAKAAGATVEFTLFYSGHGDVGTDGQGYLTLHGGKWTRHDLFTKVLATSPATVNHVLIDACRSEQFVLSRGAKGWKPDRTGVDATASVQQYLERTQLGAFPQTGVLVAHSADQQTHEWERYRGGIFTHQLISGLRGGADVNGDGRIEYSELGAFVSAANSSVDDPRARLQVVVRPPATDERYPVVSHGDLRRARVLLFTQPDARRYTVEDARGVRLADLRRTTDQPAYLRLPSGDLFVHREAATDPANLEESRVAATQSGRVLTAALQFSGSTGTPRGALDQAYRRGLFATAFGPGYYTGYTDQNGLLRVANPTWHTSAWDLSPPAQETPPGIPPPYTGPIAKGPTAEPKRERSRWGEPWGSVFVGTIVSPLGADGQIPGDPKRVTANQFRPCLVPNGPSGCSALRGFDLRWQTLHTHEDSKYPRAQWYFRTGFSGGTATFTDAGTLGGAPTRTLRYVAVPLFLGGNVYLFENFPVRPYTGLGFGFDIVRMHYEQAQGSDITKTTARIGFELHAGVEARITRYVSLNAEIMHLWSARKRLANVPQLSNENLALIFGVAFNFPLTPAERQRAHR